jgi:hypothetical protein
MCNARLGGSYLAMLAVSIMLVTGLTASPSSGPTRFDADTLYPAIQLPRVCWLVAWQLLLAPEMKFGHPRTLCPRLGPVPKYWVPVLNSST